MAITTSNSDASEVARRNLGIPSGLGLNILDDRATNAGKWVTGNSLPVWTDTDIVDSNYPTRRAFDRNPWTSTRPDGTINGNRYASLLFHLTPGSDAAHTLDTVAMQVLNGDALPSLTVRIRIAAMADFSDVIEIKTFSSANVQNILPSALLGDGDDQYTGVEYIAFVLDAPTNFSTVVPHLGSAWAGKRRQFPHEPEQTGYDDEPLSSLTTPFEADSGASVEYIKHEGRAVIPMSRLLDPFGAGVDGVQMARDFFDDIGSGTKHFFYLDEPVASPIAKGHWMKLQTPSLHLPLGGPNDRMWNSTMMELPPFQKTTEA